MTFSGIDIKKLVIRINLFIGTIAILVGIGGAVMGTINRHDVRGGEVVADIAKAEEDYFVKHEEWVFFFPDKDSMLQGFSKLKLGNELLHDKFLFEVFLKQNNSVAIRALPNQQQIVNPTFLPAVYEYDFKKKSGKWLDF
jgi:hypothetical protein